MKTLPAAERHAFEISQMTLHVTTEASEAAVTTTKLLNSGRLMTAGRIVLAVAFLFVGAGLLGLSLGAGIACYGVLSRSDVELMSLITQHGGETLKSALQAERQSWVNHFLAVFGAGALALRLMWTTGRFLNRRSKPASK